jgi:glycosyltransferase involved in cell wall biosynthesis
MRKRVFDHSAGFLSLAKKYLDIPKLISKRISQIPHAVIYNGINVDEFRSTMSKKDEANDSKLGNKGNDEIWLIFAGTLGPSYDLKTVLDGFLKLNNNHCKLIIAGDGSERVYVETFIKSNRLENVKYIGRISKDSLPYLYSKCDVGLNTYGSYSNVEMSDKFYDYTAAGLAILNSLEGEVYNLVRDNSIGINYEAGSLSSFQDSLEKLIEKNCLQKFKENSHRLGLLFDQKKQLINFSDFVRKLEI